MTNPRLLAALVCGLFAATGTTWAQDGSDSPRSRSPEITTYAFMELNGGSGVGTAVRWPLPGRFSVELETNYRRAELSPMNVNLSVLYDLPGVGRVTPYVAAGAGLDQFVVADSGPSGQIVVQPGTALAVNTGGGVRIRVDENWAARSDFRWFNPIGSRAPERLRIYNGISFARQAR